MDNNKLFETLLIEKINDCEKITGIKNKKFLNDIEKYGAVCVCKNVIKKGQYFNGFLELNEKKRLDASIELLITDTRFSELFDDYDVNCCFERLCEFEYF